MNQNDIHELVFSESLNALENTFDTQKWAKNFGVDLVSNQIEIVDTICNPGSKYIVVLGSRSMGKTYAVATAIIRMCLEIPGYAVIVFGPKAEQAVRIVTEISKICKLSYLKDTIDWDTCSRSKLYFKNTSSVIALSASEMSEIEGWHGDMGVLDEAHRISSLVWRTKCLPMFSSSMHPKIIKLGISMYRGHFFESFNNASWKKLVYDWTKCPWLYRAGTIKIDNIDYPASVVDAMPLSYKQTRFPNNPELHFPSVAGMSEEDFDTQYEMKWAENIGLFLRDDDQLRLFGTHDILEEGRPFETYYFGLDFAGGSEIERGSKRDYTVLTIVRKTIDNVKEVCHIEEYQGDITDQMGEILSWIHPDYGKFRCINGSADYGSLGSAIVDYFKKVKLPISGIRYKATETITGKNYKNAIFDQFLFELRHDRVKYPAREIVEKHPLLKKAIEEWLGLERRKRIGINDEIKGASNVHDDFCNSLALGIWSCDRGNDDVKPVAKPSTYKWPGLVFGTPSYIRQGMTQKSIFDKDNGFSNDKR